MKLVYVGISIVFIAIVLIFGRCVELGLAEIEVKPMSGPDTTYIFKTKDIKIAIGDKVLIAKIINHDNFKVSKVWLVPNDSIFAYQNDNGKNLANNTTKIIESAKVIKVSRKYF